MLMLQTTKSAKLKRMIKLDRSLQMRLEWLKFSKNDGFRKKRFFADDSRFYGQWHSRKIANYRLLSNYE